MALVGAFHHEYHLYTQLVTLLDTFYQSRMHTPEDWRILVHCLHLGYYRMMPACGYEADEWSEAERIENLTRAQAEMQALGKWLRERWQRGESGATSTRGGAKKLPHLPPTERNNRQNKSILLDI